MSPRSLPRNRTSAFWVMVDGRDVMADNIACWRKCAPGFGLPAVRDVTIAAPAAVDTSHLSTHSRNRLEDFLASIHTGRRLGGRFTRAWRQFRAGVVSDISIATPVPLSN